MYNVHWVVTMSDDEERLVAEIPSELKGLVDQDSRTNKEIVQAALWREFGGQRMSALERRIEEKQRRVSMIESEKNERQRELEEERQELEALREKYSAQKQERKEEREDKIAHAAAVLSPDSWLSSMPKHRQIPAVDSDELQAVADELGIAPETLRDRVVTHIQEGE